MLQVVKNFITKLRELPQNERLIIFFVIMALAVVISGYLAFRSTMSAIPKLSESLSGINLSTAGASESVQNTTDFNSRKITK